MGYEYSSKGAFKYNQVSKQSSFTRKDASDRSIIIHLFFWQQVTNSV
ncbi:heavy metal ATPase [Corchorus olitorius]|uniref:Heavy metal ATPase n=1 Tax=Corchorus olitorius TaxID=93759 RepID=A0A1R3IVW4_9ROSI|nr:heavy metal ATPase [Corchorus olitorius]